jgi:disulfide oxidoreductase YuzD
MGKNNKIDIEWLGEPNASNYPAAKSYLSLLYDEATVTAYVNGLKKAEMVEFKAKDIFRASNLSLLGISNLHVKRDQKKIKKGDHLSPILLVRDHHRGKVVVADGYHRLCAVYHYDEDARIPCKIV